MAVLFLITAALEISLLYPDSALGRFIAANPIAETWVSPLSHAMLLDTFLVRPGINPIARKNGMRLVSESQRRMRHYPAQYPYPDQEAIRIWSAIRGIEVNIPPYDDGVAKYPEQPLGTDELLVFATAAAFAIPLVGPMPLDQVIIDFLLSNGVKFAPLMRGR